MSRKKLIIYLLIVVSLIMIVDLRYVNSQKHLFEGFITDSIREIINLDGNIFSNSYSRNNVKAEKTGELLLEEKFMRENININNFRLKNDFGSIEITGSQQNEINLDYILKVHGTDQERAEEFIQDLEIVYNIEADELEISLNKSQINTPELIDVVEIDYRIIIPERLKTNISNQYGSLKVRELKAELKAANRYGNTLIENITEKVGLDLAYGSSEIYNINSELDLKTAYTENRINNIAGRFELDSAYGFNRISSVDSVLNYRSRYGGAEINKLNSDLNINSRYTGFKIRDVGGIIRADLEYGDIKLSQIRNLDLKLRYADVEIDSITDYELYNYNLKAEYGSIEAKLGGISYDNENELNYQGQQAEYELKINSKYGDIYIK